jgi:bifunctional DNA-binding transcriptional regulator/antitoxin component of YhaV-PrlF toxin-antitoxin module
VGFIVPKHLAEQLAVKEGDELYVTATSEGLLVSPYDPDFAAVAADAREFMRTHRNAFKELAR